MNLVTQLKKLRIQSLLIAPALAAIAVFTPLPARATPSCGVTTIDLLHPNNPPNILQPAFFPSGSLDLMCRSNLPDWLLFTRVRGDSDFYVTQHTFDAGGQTGWHSHPGPSLITVVEGTLTVYHPGCRVETFTAGQSFTDIGCGDLHNVRNEGATEAIDVAVQIVPHLAPRRIDEPDQGCVPLCTPTPPPR
jgi:quercetin dioxygenase-like cupin family protein